MNMLHVFVLGEWQPIEVRGDRVDMGSVWLEWAAGKGSYRGTNQPDTSVSGVYMGTSPGALNVGAEISMEWPPVSVLDAALYQSVRCLPPSHWPGKSISWLVSSQRRKKSGSSWREGTIPGLKLGPQRPAQGKLIWKFTVLDTRHGLVQPASLTDDKVRLSSRRGCVQGHS